MNAKHSLWGNPVEKCDARGDMILEFVLAHGLTIFNDRNSEPTFLSSRGESWIDLTLGRLVQPTSLVGWELVDQTSASEHRRVQLEVTTTIPEFLPSNRIGIKDLNLPRFREALTDKLGGMSPDWLDGRSVDSAIEKLTSLIQDACKTCKRPFKQRKRAVPWWSLALSNERKKVLAARRRYRRCEDAELKKHYCVLFSKARSAFRRSVRRAKWKHFRSVLEEVDPRKPFGPHFRWARGKRAVPLKLSTLTREDGSPTTDFQGTIEELLNFHFPEDIHLHGGEEDANDDALLTADDPEFSLKELEAAIRACNRKKAPGLDGLSMEIMELVFRANKTLFLAVLNKCLREGTFPSKWKISELVLFNKDGKDRKDPGSYRPICLLPAWSKVLDKLVIGRLYYHLSKSTISHPDQFGFMPGKGTEHAIKSLYDKINRNKSEGLDTCVVMLDVKSAFNNLWWNSIFKALKQMRCPVNIFKLIKSFFTNRQVTYRTPTSSETHAYSKGCPQGSNSGPFYWILVAMSLLALDLGLHAEILAYADDFVLVITAPNAYQCGRRAEVALRRIAQWAELHKLEFSAKKTQAVFCQKPHRLGWVRRGPRTKPRISFLGAPVKFAGSQRYLGCMIDENLNGYAHVAKIRNDIANYVIGVHSLSQRDWGLNGMVLKNLYKRGLERIATYACGSWWTGSVRMRAKLNSAQRLALLGITRCYRTTSTSALQVLAGTLPLDLQVEYEHTVTQLRTFRKSVTAGNISFEADNVQFPVERWLYHPARAPYIDWDKDPPTGRGREIFTDGSKMEDRVGSGVAVFLDGIEVEGRSFRCSDNSTVFQAELTAIIRALEYLEQCNVDANAETHIYSDSQSSLWALSGVGSLDLLVNNIHELARGKNLKWHWVRAHVGTEGNERADELAKAGSEKDHVDCEIKWALQVCRSKLKKEFVSRWQWQWENCNTGRRVFERMPKVKELRAWTSPGLNWLVTGHGPFPAYFLRFGLRGTRNCDFCNTQEPADGFHILIDCPGTKRQRKKFCPKLTRASLENYFSLREGRASLNSLMLAIVDSKL